MSLIEFKVGLHYILSLHGNAYLPFYYVMPATNDTQSQLKTCVCEFIKLKKMAWSSAGQQIDSKLGASLCKPKKREKNNKLLNTATTFMFV